MKQIVIVHGGSSFNSYENYLDSLKNSSLHYERLLWAQKWREWLAQTTTGYDVLLPDFPNKQNAQYEEWNIFRKTIAAARQRCSAGRLQPGRNVFG